MGYDKMSNIILSVKNLSKQFHDDHSVILENDPVSLETFLPYLHRSLLAVMDSFKA